MAGRKRSSGKRHPSGKLVQKMEPGKHPSEWLRLKKIIENQAKDPRLGSELGRLFFFEEIDSCQFDAGTKWQQLVIRYRLVISAPADVPKVKALGEQFGISLTDISKEEAEGVKRAYCESFEHLNDHAAGNGRAVLRALNDLVIRDQPTTTQQKTLAIRGLSALVKLWGLTNKGKK